MKALFIALFLAGLGTPAIAEDDLSSVEKAVVIVVVKAYDQNHVPKEVHGTGFFISKEGYLVTSYHLLRKMGDAMGKEVSIEDVLFEVRFGPANNAYIAPASLHWFHEPSDLIVLFASVEEGKIAVLKRGRRDGITLGVTPVYAAGYPAGYQYSVRPGAITAFGVLDARPMWQVNLSFKEGQSGSPICRGDATVVAVAKGNDEADPTFGLVVSIKPIASNLWDQ